MPLRSWPLIPDPESSLSRSEYSIVLLPSMQFSPLNSIDASSESTFDISLSKSLEHWPRISCMALASSLSISECSIVPFCSFFIWYRDWTALMLLLSPLLLRGESDRLHADISSPLFESGGDAPVTDLILLSDGGDTNCSFHCFESCCSGRMTVSPIEETTVTCCSKGPSNILCANSILAESERLLLL